MLSRLALCLSLVVVACGDDAPMQPDAPGGGDAAVDAAPSLTDLERLQQLVAALPGAASDTARRELVAAFVHDVAYSGGFPIVGDGQLGIALYDDQNRSPAFTVAGDFNSWNASALQLVQPVAGFPFYYAITPLTPPTTRSLYKLVHGGTDYFADPIARRFGFDSFGQYSLITAGSAQSHLERWPDFAGGGLAPREVDVYVPAGYEGGTATYPVLYMHDGNNLFDPAAIWGGWHVADAADAGMDNGTIRPALIAGIWNTSARMDEYTQTPDDIGQVVGGKAGEYAQLVDAVVTFVDGHYRTKPTRADRGVMGSSLGGIVSAYLAVTRSQTFGFAGSMSGTFGWGSIGAGTHNPTLMQLANATPPTGVSFYLDSGGGPGSGCVDTDSDGVRDDTADADDNYCETLDFRATLTSKGWVDGTNLFYVFDSGAAHNEAAWAARLPHALRTWFPGPP